MSPSKHSSNTCLTNTATSLQSTYEPTPNASTKNGIQTSPSKPYSAASKKSKHKPKPEIGHSPTNKSSMLPIPSSTTRESTLTIATLGLTHSQPTKPGQTSKPTSTPLIARLSANSAQLSPKDTTAPMPLSKLQQLSKPKTKLRPKP